MWVLDESSYRIDKTNFASREEAEQKAGESARILGRPISVYRLMDQKLIFDFAVNPDGSLELESPTHEPKKEEEVEDPGTPILGSVEVLDEVADVLEKAGRVDLASMLDTQAHLISNKSGASVLAKKLKNSR